MSDLKRILVGVDLLQSQQGELSPPVAEAVKHSLWLADQVSAEITFFAAVELLGQEDLYTPLGEQARIAGQVEAAAQVALGKLVRQASAAGVAATSKLAKGEGWVELTREKIEGKHDVVVVGTRNFGAFRRALFGSTAMKLLHNCPGPVWVTKPQSQPAPQNVLVASDYSEVSDEAVRLALRLGSAEGTKIHVIHAIERPYARLQAAGLVESEGDASHHQRNRDVAEKGLRDQLARAAGVASAAEANIEIHVVESPSVADDAILHYIDANQIDLLVMGTSARRGMAGIFVGNTAERLLSAVPCSLLAVKPADFVCPVSLESYRDSQRTAYL